MLRGTYIVVPLSLQEKAVSLAHEEHQGIVKTKQLIHEKVWFPGIDRLVERRIETCNPCQSVVPTNNREPLEMSELPFKPWDKVGVDFVAHFPQEITSLL